METIAVRLEKSGRILLPAEWRRRLHVKPGQELIISMEDDRIQILGTRAEAIKRVQQRLRKYVSAGRMLSDELSDERRKKSASEDSK
jgi:AbrB family looped-hinge helix DNA binding protein